MTSASDQAVIEDPAKKAAELLEHHRAQLHAIPGVLATGIGFSKRLRDRTAIIQVFVRSEADSDAVLSEARKILGGFPLEVIISGDVQAGHETKHPE